jgi:hypothetical protein
MYSGNDPILESLKLGDSVCTNIGSHKCPVAHVSFHQDYCSLKDVAWINTLAFCQNKSSIKSNEALGICHYAFQ